MREERVNLLLRYLSTLMSLNEGMYNCTKEITKTIKAIEEELDI